GLAPVTHRAGRVRRRDARERLQRLFVPERVQQRDTALEDGLHRRGARRGEANLAERAALFVREGPARPERGHEGCGGQREDCLHECLLSRSMRDDQTTTAIGLRKDPATAEPWKYCGLPTSDTSRDRAGCPRSGE